MFPEHITVIIFVGLSFAQGMSVNLMRSRRGLTRRMSHDVFALWKKTVSLELLFHLMRSNWETFKCWDRPISRILWEHVKANSKQRNDKFPPLYLSDRKVKDLNTFIVGFCCRHPNFDLRSHFPVFIFRERGFSCFSTYNSFEEIIATEKQC